MVDVKGRMIFLSGPVTGLDPDEAAVALLDARKALRSLGAQECYAPTEHVAPDSTHEAAMLRCLRELLWMLSDGTKLYDMLVSLPGWRDSAGARLEREVAEACGIECHDLGEVVPGD